MLSKGKLDKVLQDKVAAKNRGEMTVLNVRGKGSLKIFWKPAPTIAAPKAVSRDWYAVAYAGTRRAGMSRLGAYAALTLDQARADFMALVDGAGIKSETAKAAAVGRAVDAGITLQDLCDAYVAKLTRRNSRSTKAAKGLLDKAANSIGASRPAASITQANIVAYLGGVFRPEPNVERPAAYRVARAYLHSAFAAAITVDPRQPGGVRNWGITGNPVTGIEPGDKSPGTRNLTPAEIRAFWTWLNGYSRRSLLARVPMLIIAAGQRVEENLRLATPDASERRALAHRTAVRAAAKAGAPVPVLASRDTPVVYDPAERTMTGVMSKKDNAKQAKGELARAHIVPLPAQAVEVLDAMITPTSGLYFANSSDPTKFAPHTSVNKVIQIYIEETGAEPFTPKDLRRTWHSRAGEAGIPYEWRERIQNHTMPGEGSRTYDHAEYLSQMRVHMDTWSAYLARILAGKLDNAMAKAA